MSKSFKGLKHLILIRKDFCLSGIQTQVLVCTQVRGPTSLKWTWCWVQVLTWVLCSLFSALILSKSLYLSAILKSIKVFLNEGDFSELVAVVERGGGNVWGGLREGPGGRHAVGGDAVGSVRHVRRVVGQDAAWNQSEAWIRDRVGMG